MEREPGAGAPAGALGSDGEVLRITAAVRRGDPEAFAVLYEAWFGRAYGAARSLTRRDESFCLDVVQDAFLRVARSLRPLATRAALDGWMVRTVRTAAIDRLRREARRARHEGRAADGRPGAIEADDGRRLVAEEEAAWLRGQVEGLPEGDRALLAARFGAGRTLRDAGAAAGITGHAAHGRIRRIIERLRRAARETFHG